MTHPLGAATPDSTDPTAGAAVTPSVAPAAGIVDGLPDAEYHARKDSLSVSGAKLLLPPSCPAVFKWQRDNPPPSKPHFDFGSAAHKSVLGVGQPVRYINADSWRSKAAQQAQTEAYAAGEIPLLEEQRGVIEGMTAALRAHPLASALLNPENGRPEVSLFALDPDTGVNLRGRLDFLPNPRGGRMLIPDYKTSTTANPELFAKSAANFFYHGQASWYSDLVVALELADDPAFLFVIQDKNPPYIVSVVELDPDALRIGRQLNRRAIEIYRDCMYAGIWPGFSSEVEQVSLPYWYVREHEVQTW